MRSKHTLLVALVLLLAGCNPKPGEKGAEVKEEKKPEALPAMTVNLGPGTDTHYAPGEKRDPQWFISWQKQAAVDLAQVKVKPGEKPTVGPDGKEKKPALKNEISHMEMLGVSGYVFDKGKESSTYTADAGQGDKKTQTLSLHGNVHVISKNPKSELFCDRLEYDASKPKKLIRAEGHVRVVQAVGTIGTLPALWASPDLKVVATPDLYNLR